MNVPPGSLVFIVPKWLALAFLAVESAGVVIVGIAVALGKAGLP